MDFKNSITSDSLNSLANWVPSLHFCNWTGVTCDSTSKRVQVLELADRQLEGSISPSLGNLSSLTKLDLLNNSFVGRVPQEVGRIQGLKVLYLSFNQLQGSIPKNLSSCKELRELVLGENRFTGNIPAELSLLTNLQVLSLGSNNLSGGIPPSFGNLSLLKSFHIGDADLEGRIPPELGMLSRLASLVLFENRLTGLMPSSISNCSALVELALYSNGLTGMIPKELGKLSRLQVLYLWDNQLHGTIPATIANCTQLLDLDVELNHLGGAVPLELSRLSYLQFLSLSSNRLVSGSTFTIPILAALRNCTGLNEIWFDNNYLTGYLPEQLPTNLSVLRLDGNKITGNIPSLIANITNLRDLYLSSNLLTGLIPSSLKSLWNLQRLVLDNNKLEGNIPSEIGEIKSLGELSLSHNRLSGEIPATIGGLQQFMTHLVLNHNQLSGNVPASLGSCRNLQLLDLSNNRFSGSIPHEVAGLSNLQFYFNLSRNSFQGSLPLEIGKMIHVEAIDVSANRLQGRIPATLGSCEQLQHLNLSSNELQGPMPNSLSRLKDLESIDLSSNNLSGLIPASLESLNMLQYLNLSFNNFSGEVPKEGIFRNLSASSFEGNEYLCGEWMQLSACPSHKTDTNTSRIRIFAPVGGAICVFLFFCLLILGIVYRRYKVKSDVPGDILPLKVIDDGGISYKEIVKATGGFDEENLLGTGSFGSVYKGIMGDSTVAAFKHLQLQNEEASKSFFRECKVLAEVRHRNLVKIISFCLESGHKILVLEFMSRGNLEKLLHSKGASLSFREILNIAIDVIHGLEYLHHDCFQQVVHCDIKPSNILMDEDMTAHVADFGIARMICGSDGITINSGTTLKGSVGYIAPEYGLGEKVSTRGDMYSYGVMLLEMVTGKNPTNHIFVGGLTLHKWVSIHFGSKLKEIIDIRMMRDLGEYEINQCLIPFIHLGLECSKGSPNERPTAREAAGVLECIRKTLLEA